MKNKPFGVYKLALRILSLSLVLVLLSSCAQNAQAEIANSITLSEGATLGEDTKDGANAIALLPEGAQAMFPTQVPSFLTADLQELYKAAYYMALHHDLSIGFNVNPEGETITLENGTLMYKDTGFASYDDYMKAMQSVFSQGTIDFMATQTETPLYAAGEDGALYAAGEGRGANIEYVESSFELVTETDYEIQYVEVGHYDKTLGGEAEDITSTQYETNYRTTIVLTEDGWRFGVVDLPF